MELPVNRLRQGLASGRHMTGLWCSLPSAYVAEALAGAGFDWLLFDTEHAPADPVTVLPLLQAAAAHEVALAVRPAANDPVLIKRLLDLGAQTLLIPMVNSAAEAAAAVAAMRYPPRGLRGVAGLTRAAGFGRIPGYVTRAEAELCCLVQVESRAALDAIEEIAAVEGVDGLFIGPADLAASLGYPGQSGHDVVLAEIEGAIRRIAAAGKPAGILALDDDSARRFIGWGTRFTAVSSDMTLLVRAADELARRFAAGQG